MVNPEGKKRKAGFGRNSGERTTLYRRNGRISVQARKMKKKTGEEYTCLKELIKPKNTIIANRKSTEGSFGKGRPVS